MYVLKLVSLKLLLLRLRLICMIIDNHLPRVVRLQLRVSPDGDDTIVAIIVFKMQKPVRLIGIRTRGLEMVVKSELCRHQRNYWLCAIT